LGFGLYFYLFRALTEVPLCVIINLDCIFGKHTFSLTEFLEKEGVWGRKNFFSKKVLPPPQTKLMKSIGIICECNPFHGGHEYLIRMAREAGAECVVAVMSGSFVQRGEPAVADAHLRAKAVLLGGADLVLELPFPYSAAPAEFFAAAGVEILSSLGVSELWFGSECGDIELLQKLAAISESEAFLSAYAESTSQNRGTAEAYIECLSRMSGEAVSLSSNDLLGIAYLRAIRKKGAVMRPVTIKREGSAYLETELGGSFPSATALRKKWRESGVEEVLPHLPQSTRDVYRGCGAPADMAYAERLILGHFRLTPTENLEKIAELSGGLGARLKKAAIESATLEEMLAAAATKKYTNARILRGIVFALAGISERDLRTPPVYSRLLAANDAGCSFLKENRKTEGFAVVTRRTDLPKTQEAMRQDELEAQACFLYALCAKNAEFPKISWEKAAFITKKLI